MIKKGVTFTFILHLCFICMYILMCIWEQNQDTTLISGQEGRNIMTRYREKVIELWRADKSHKNSIKRTPGQPFLSYFRIIHQLFLPLFPSLYSIHNNRMHIHVLDKRIKRYYNTKLKIANYLTWSMGARKKMKL